ncbi:hypothetical protein LCGC14_1534990 [marine sediment metagenome]|uniref:Uncharacterized protein n=1 Tax=marine sediment metagenome TaxID=412755 RepID=A0A0F9IUT8_9ZZZZ
MKAIELKAGLCSGRLMKSSDGRWLTNGHWMVLAPLTKRTKATPELDEHNPDIQTVIGEVKSGDPYRKATTSYVRINTDRMVIGNGEVLAWVNEDYADAFFEIGTIWARHSSSPIVVTAGEKWDITDAMAFVMPVRAPEIYKDEKEALQQWLKNAK